MGKNWKTNQYLGWISQNLKVEAKKIEKDYKII